MTFFVLEVSIILFAKAKKTMKNLAYSKKVTIFAFAKPR